MVKDHSHIERGHHYIGYSFQVAARGVLYPPTDRVAHTNTFGIPIGQHWLEWEIAQVSTIKDRSNNPSHYEQILFYGAASCSTTKIQVWFG